ncbi:hypothetical protein DFP72DRAFT_552533 [Ephemerocybe angulata]|uniref:Uncharacterized protein n=1 Tax=Ephemerocybe angulata TaxID=980116 RepID=A0A8H6HML5_9AGAR|nr:hypothetical protein DFP72DRAFT_552533 [Tulosesus angulatus]
MIPTSSCPANCISGSSTGKMRIKYDRNDPVTTNRTSDRSACNVALQAQGTENACAQRRDAIRHVQTLLDVPRACYRLQDHPHAIDVLDGRCRGRMRYGKATAFKDELTLRQGHRPTGMQGDETTLHGREARQQRLVKQSSLRVTAAITSRQVLEHRRGRGRRPTNSASPYLSRLRPLSSRAPLDISDGKSNGQGTANGTKPSLAGPRSTKDERLCALENDG